MKTTRLAAALLVAGTIALLQLPVARNTAITPASNDPVAVQPRAKETDVATTGIETPSNIAEKDAASTPALAGKKLTQTEATMEWPRVLYPELERIRQLENLHSDEALGELSSMLGDIDPVIRLAALEAIAELDHPARASMLMAVLNDPLAQIRIAALQALSIRDDPSAWAYIEPGLFDMDDEVRLAAIDALAVLESAEAVHSLAGLLFDQNRRIRISAVNAMGEIGGEAAYQYLQQLRYDPDEHVRASVLAILAEAN